MSQRSFAVLLIVAALIVLGAIAMHHRRGGWLSHLAPAIHGHR